MCGELGTGMRRRIESGGVGLELAVEFGGRECVVDWQYVSNRMFAEIEICNWWREEQERGHAFMSDQMCKRKLAELL